MVEADIRPPLSGPNARPTNLEQACSWHSAQPSGRPQCPWRIGKRGQDHPTRIFGFWTFVALWLNWFCIYVSIHRAVWTVCCMRHLGQKRCLIRMKMGRWVCLSVWRPTYHQLLPRPRLLWTLEWYSVFFFTWKAAGSRLKLHPSHLISVDCQRFWHLFSRYVGLVNFQCVGWHLRFGQ